MTSIPSRITHWVGGESWRDAPERTAPVTNPATGAVTGHVDLASVHVVDSAVTSARTAWEDGWGRSSLSRRTSVLFAFRELLHRHTDRIAALVTAEHGKVLADARGEVARGLEVAELACGIPSLLQGAASDSVATDLDVRSLRQPLGVVAVITPFNFPVMVPLWFVPVALACGNTVVLKPSEKDPSAALAVARLWTEAGLPDGALSVVHGDGEAVDALIAHEDVAAVSFVGSTPVARHVHEVATSRGKRVQALGGAKNHMFVLPDADLDQAADAAVSAGFGSAGERCMAISAVVVHEAVADDLVARIAERTRALRTGDGSTGADMGPLVTAEHRDRVRSFVDGAAGEGATVVVDGREGPVDGTQSGFFLPPTLLDHVGPAMAVYVEEIFGPVLSVLRVGSFDAGLRLINAHRYGNGAAIFTRDGASARRFEREVEVGMVGVNVPIPVPAAHFSFGGWKDSLFGDLHAYGPDGVSFFTRGKVVTTRWPSADAGVDLGFPTHR
ncbi:MAG: CoA-acylating methylmalonate-semialdehyde dehydrogenase [Ornithinimicrobium sp.]|uniref:CoA-acylating methylmalonate-semialdehyde dehydrogenase n=1 Tax=Ornithinimicrobium sp. TaxID=1977084 RepID=UPI003D9B5C86